MPKTDPNSRDTIIAGSMSRFATKGPKPNRRLLRRLKAFVLKWCKKNLKPLDFSKVQTFDEWLDSRPYPQWRKEQLREKWKALAPTDQEALEVVLNDKKYHDCKSFMKDEFYADWKHARAINSRSDEFKCAIGPIISAIEHEVYKHPSFIKHVPVNERAEFIYQKLYRPGAKYAASDYTAFESLFTEEIMSACEFVLYKYMLQNCPKIYMKLLNVLKGMTRCFFKKFMVKVKATRMSGEMNTSLGNGFSNLMFMLFMCDLVGMKNVDGVVEGDDGLFVGEGKWPTKEQFEELGLIIKLDLHDELNAASFCGLIFDLNDRVNVTDPREVLASFGWTSRQYARSKSNKMKMLLRAKALSLAYQYPGCPVIQSLAEYALRMTASFDVRHYAANGIMSMWDREQLLEAISNKHKLKFPEPKMGTRTLVETKFGITIGEQLELEEYFRNKNDLKSMKLPWFNAKCPQSWNDYYSRYAVSMSPDRPDLEYPVIPRSTYPGFRKEWDENFKLGLN